MSLFDTGVRPIIDNYLLEESKKVRDYNGYWSASSAGYCMRKLIFERLKVESTLPDDPRKQRVFSAGHIFHDWIQKQTREAGVSVAQEVELQDEDLMIRGHFDDLILVGTGVMDFKETGVEVERKKLILYDYKTVNSRSFMWAKKNGGEMSHYHKMQLGTYMYMLRKKPFTPDGTDLVDLTTLTDARILKIEKENLMMMEQQLMWSPELEKEVVGYWRTLNGYWKAKKIPKCTCEDYEGGFLAKEKYNPFYYNGQPCSLEWYAIWKEKNNDKLPDTIK